ARELAPDVERRESLAPAPRRPSFEQIVGEEEGEGAEREGIDPGAVHALCAEFPCARPGEEERGGGGKRDQSSNHGRPAGDASFAMVPVTHRGGRGAVRRRARERGEGGTARVGRPRTGGSTASA